MMKQLQQRSKTGYSLVELAVVLMIIGVLVGTFYSIYGAQAQARRMHVTKARVALIKEALDDYVALYGRVPCPANLFADAAGDAYGTEMLHPYDDVAGKRYYFCSPLPRDFLFAYVHQIASGDGVWAAGTLNGQNSDMTIADYLDSLIAAENAPVLLNDVLDLSNPETDLLTTRVMGSVPFETLGLPASAALDGWGNKLHYATVIGNSYAPWFYLSELQGIPSFIPVTYLENTGNQRVAHTRYIVASMGPNQFGATDQHGQFNDRNAYFSASDFVFDGGTVSDGEMTVIRSVLLGTMGGGFFPKPILEYANGADFPLIDDVVAYGAFVVAP